MITSAVAGKVFAGLQKDMQGKELEPSPVEFSVDKMEIYVPP